MKYILSALFSVILMSSIKAECMLYEVSINDRFNNAAIVVEGVEINSKTIKIDGYIYTIHNIEVTTIFKGNQVPEIIQIATPGGRFGDEMLVVTPSLKINNNEKGVFFIQDKLIVDKAHRVYSGPQGFIRYDLENNIATDPFNTFNGIQDGLLPILLELSGNAFKRVKQLDLSSQSNNKAGAGPITDISPKTISAGTKSILTITGSNFGVSRGTGRIDFENASSGPTTVSPASAQYISWTDNEIKVEVPSEAGTGPVKVIKSGTSTSQDDLTIEYAQLNVTTTNGFAFPVDHINDNINGGYDWRMSDSFDGNTSANNSFQRAMQNWIDATCVNWNLIESTLTDKTSQDGTNIIRFGGPGEVSNGVLATTSSYYGSCNGGTVWFVRELDMTYSSDIQWNYDQSSPKNFEYDIESVTVHELGHAHQLGHVIDESDIMHRAIGAGDLNRTLNGSNRKAGNFVQAQSIVKNICGPGEMSNFPSCTSVLNVNEVDMNSKIEVYPNPASDLVWIEFNSINGFPLNYQVIDYTGKVVKTGQCFSKMNRVDVSNLSSGLYLISIDGPGEQMVSKIILE